MAFACLGRHALDEPVHQLAPGPEIVLAGSAHLGEAGHRALEGVRMQVGHSGENGAGELLAFPAKETLEMAPLSCTSIQTSRAHPCGSSASRAKYFFTPL